MYINDFSLTIYQCGSFDDAEDVTVTFEVDEKENRKVFIRQSEGDVQHEIFLDGKSAVLDLMKALSFLIKNGWEDV